MSRIQKSIGARLNESVSREMVLRRQIRELREALTGLSTAFHGAWVDAGYDAEDLGDEYTEALAVLKATEPKS